LPLGKKQSETRLWRHRPVGIAVTAQLLPPGFNARKEGFDVKIDRHKPPEPGKEKNTGGNNHTGEWNLLWAYCLLDCASSVVKGMGAGSGCSKAVAT